MICPKCQFENDDDSRFCTNCGAQLETVNAWYYMDQEEQKGPYSESELQQMYENQTINKNTFVWTEGLEDWILFRDSKLMNEQAEPAAALAPEETIWYYDHLGQSQGPHTRNEMIQFIQNQTILANTYVWKQGMKDWILLKDSELASYMPHQQAPVNPGGFGVQKRSVILSIVLSFVTCGIYLLYWYYQISEDVNAICERNNQPKAFDPFLNIILIIVTCGLYSIYFLWKSSKIVYSYKPNIDDTMVVTILAVFMSPIACAILQDELNSYA